MSAVLMPETIVVRREERVQEPARRPQTRTVRRSRRVSASAWLYGATVKTVTFGLMVMAFYLVSMIAGQTLMEQARRDGLRSMERARVAESEVVILRESLRRLTSVKAVDLWAKSRGFVAREQASAVPAESMRVAFRE